MVKTKAKLPTKKFTPEVRAAWVKALSSGKYKQCRGTLIRGSADKPKAFCCLGVLDKILGADLELSDTAGSLGGLTQAQRAKFIDINDGGKFNFKQIAYMVRAKTIV